MKKSNKVVANQEIRHKSVRLVGENGSAVLQTHEAQRQADEADLDLIMINDKTDPPICKILDLNKYRYEMQMKEKEAARAQKENRITVKEVQFKPNIDNHDFDTKCRNIARFIRKGNHVKVLVQFRGREKQHTDIGYELINRIMESVGEVELEGKKVFTGNRIIAVLKSSAKNEKAN